MSLIYPSTTKSNNRKKLNKHANIESTYSPKRQKISNKNTNTPTNTSCISEFGLELETIISETVDCFNFDEQDLFLEESSSPLSYDIECNNSTVEELSFTDINTNQENVDHLNNSSSDLEEDTVGMNSARRSTGRKSSSSASATNADQNNVDYLNKSFFDLKVESVETYSVRRRATPKSNSAAGDMNTNQRNVKHLNKPSPGLKEDTLETNPVRDRAASKPNSSAEFIYMGDKLVIILPKNSQLYFYGLMSVKILHGAAEILGYTLTPSSPSQELYSLRGSSLLFIKNVSSNVTVNEKSIQEFLLKEKIDLLQIKLMLKKIDPNKSVIFCTKIRSAKIDFLVRHIAQQIFPSRSFPCTFDVDNIGANLLNMNPEWDSIIANIDNKSKILLSGGKGVGKSTALRYIVNKLLMKYKEVFVLDLDPGQPEFTVPGCLSASIVTDPMFGPNYSHLREPYKCVFMPTVDISAQPIDYINKVKLLMSLCEDLQSMPTIINYMGYTRGFGLNIFSSVVLCVKPSAVIEISSGNYKRNFSQRLTHNLIYEFSKTLTPNLGITDFSITTISSMTDDNKGWILEPRKIREMCVLCYFGSMFTEGKLYIADITTHIYLVKSSFVKIIQDNEIVSPAIVNANLVALCKFIPNFKSYMCYGWGIVKGVDYEKETLYIITPIKRRKLQCVDSIVLGPVGLPPSVHMAACSVKGEIPYVANKILPTLGKISKRSHLPVDRT